MRIVSLPRSEGWSCATIVAELDRYIIGQEAAKRSVAIALRNRWRRLRIPEDLRKEVVPNNIIMIGPTGVGKTEIARRLSQIAGLPFLKVEATKFTERGYVGRDVDSMVRDLVENAIVLLKRREESRLLQEIDVAVEERLIDALFPPLASEDPERQERWQRSRDKIRQQLRDHVLDDREVTITGEQTRMPIANIFTSAGEEFDASFSESLKNFFPKQRTEKIMPVAEAKRVLHDQELEKRLDMDRVVQEAVQLVEQGGIIFLDEIDKIAGRSSPGSGPDVSREVRACAHGSCAVHRGRSIPYEQTQRLDPGAAGTISHPGGAGQSHRGGLCAHPARDRQLAAQAVHGAARRGRLPS
jgi:ATP-dependent HslUV protease ATP-binding subunit HslU